MLLSFEKAKQTRQPAMKFLEDAACKQKIPERLLMVREDLPHR